MFGAYLRIDLGSGAATRVALDPAIARRFIGGVGLGAWLLHHETPRDFDPLGAEAAVIFAFGPLLGTPLTTSAKYALVAKSPLTGRIGDALSSSRFAVEAKRMAVDAIVITGCAARPSILILDEAGASLEAADDLWGHGLSVSDAARALAARFPEHTFALIGPAGEHLVRYAGVTNDGRHAGRGGLGAVLGAKRLKAIGVRGARRVPLADAAKTIALSKALARRSLGPATEKYRELGTVGNLAAFNRLAALPTRNFQASTFEGAADVSGEVLQATRRKGRGSCTNCTIGCEHFFEVTPGEAPVKAEYESVFALGPLCGVRDPEIVLRASRRCDELGLDTISAGGTIAFAMECAERGLFDGTAFAAEARGLRFGDGARLLGLLEDIAFRRGALADLLAEGSRSAAARLGPPAPDFAPHVKGLELPGYEPRALQSMALGFSVGSRGADHNRSGAYEADFSGQVDRFCVSTESARQAIATEDRAAVLDSLILCKFLRGTLVDFYGESAELLAAVTGFDCDADELRRAARRIVLLKRLFNEREGWTCAEDTLPERFFTQALTQGAADGAVISRAGLARSIAAYYEARGLRSDGTIPAETLRANQLDPL
ncbi:MAG TPA: aldehyde ferredoxin oxidoreductase family protein [Kofleriaceae bacterium]|nr:aldehyde ferredoxin oxidoreductase family protein [Kofleriaceae bacterium]